MASEVDEGTQAMINRIVENSRRDARGRLVGVDFQIAGEQAQLDALLLQREFLVRQVEAANEYLGDEGEVEDE